MGMRIGEPTVTHRHLQMQKVAGGSLAAIGVGFAVAPVAASRFWQLAPGSAATVPYLARILGASYIGLGAVTVLTRGQQRSAILRISAVVGASTAVSAALARTRHRLGNRGALMAVVTAGTLATLAWAAAES